MIVYKEILRDPFIKTVTLVQSTGYSEPTINRAIKSLKNNNLIVRVGANKKGYWDVLK